jgi:D-psicose/D-tagatose/L-ribulose 3-epimerase
LVNQIGVHALVWTGRTDPDSLRAALNRTKEAGYDLLELSLFEMDSVDVAATRRAAEDLGVGLVCSRGLAFDADISSADPEISAHGERLLADSVRMARDLGAGYLAGALYSALGKYDRPLDPRGRDHVVSALGRISELAANAGITLGLEIVNRYESNVVNTAAQGLRLIDEIGADNLKLHLDTYHMNIEEDDFVRPVRQAGERLGYVHIGESHRGYLGSGHVDFTGFFHALADIDYTGPITFESFSSAVIAPGLSNDLAIWRNLWDDGADLARHARDFLASHLHAARGRTGGGR